MNPAGQLKGVTLASGWTVLDFAIRKPNATGGHFSHGYVAEHRDGRMGFLKAMDYIAAFESPSTAEVLQAMSSAYIFEKALCQKCSHLSRIARAIDAGEFHTNPQLPHTKVEYLIFELADRDIRAQLDVLDLQRKLDMVFLMRTLHHVTVGLAQLHNAGVAHQDLKPSNVLVYGPSVGSKICDLGRAWDKHRTAPHDGFNVAGDRAYAPFELLYGELPSDAHTRRFGCDLYHLGSLITFLFTRVHTTALVLQSLDQTHWPNFWGGSYSEVLPFVQAAFDIAIATFAEYVPGEFRPELQRFVLQLCNPDPARRGDPSCSRRNQFSLERYISRFDRLAHEAELAVA